MVVNITADLILTEHIQFKASEMMQVNERAVG